MLTLSATCLAIAMAIETDTLTIEEKEDHRFGGTYFVIGDAMGMIEIAADKAELDERIDGIKKRLA